MPRYIANPIEVDAHRISHFNEVDLQVSFEDGSSAVVSREMMSRMIPRPGDYYVRQADGYVYLNPKDVFERKYRLKEGV